MVRFTDPSTGVQRRASESSSDVKSGVEQTDGSTSPLPPLEQSLNLAPPASCPLSAIHHLTNNGPIKVNNLLHYKTQVDQLHLRTKGHYCLGSLINPMPPNSKVIKIRSKGEILEQAVDFIEEYFIENKKKNTSDEENCLSARLMEIKKELDSTGSYTLTTDELKFGAKTAWRNASRCIGRIQWNNIDIFDCRHVRTAQEMFDALCRHIKNATNGGNIRSSITVFPQRVQGREDFRLWNHQLFAFAGYQLPDGTIVGDPARVPFTRVCQRLGWQPKNGTPGPFDILPLVLSAPGEGPKWYEIPEELIMLIDLEHPTFEWFKDLGLKWYAVPAVADMLFDVGGIEFPAAPFNGWYMGTEIGSRNLCDENRYNLFPVIGAKMGLDTSSDSSLWKDRVLVETNTAVLHSFVKRGVTIVDHHTASQSFLTHMAKESKVRGGCPADWVWIVPPMSSSSTGVFHQEMVNYQLKPSYEYQEAAWKSYKWEKVTLKYSFRSVAKSVLSIVKLMKGILDTRTKVTVLYATETGKSEFLSDKLTKTLRENFSVKMIKMDEYNFEKISEERILFMVASTFGNGDPPDNGKSFWKQLNFRLRRFKASSNEEERRKYMLSNLYYSVFGLGSSLYPTFGAFGINLDKTFSLLGAKRIRPITIGDELRGQQKLFSVWRQSVTDRVVQKFVQKSIDDFCTDDESEVINPSEVGDTEAFNDDFYVRENSRLFVVSASRSKECFNTGSGGDSFYLEDMLSQIHGEKKYPNLLPLKVRRLFDILCFQHF